MSQQTIKPTNLYTVKVDEQNSRQLKEVKTGQIFSQDNNFHPEGLFSTEVFGPVGSEQRQRTFGVIHLNVEILHPLIYLTVISLKSFYRQIIDGSTTAEWNNETKEFVKSTGPNAQTGFTFFLSHVKELKFEQTDSEQRSYKIKLLEKAIKEDSLTTRFLLVMPAGLRDYMVDKNGRPSEDEVNTFYRRVLAQATIIDQVRSKRTPEVYDGAAVGIQQTVVELYEYVKSLLDGKNKLILDKWVGRKVFNSTRNVISAYIDKSDSLNDKRKLGYNETLVGLHQYVRAAAPKSIFEIKNKYIRDVFPDNSRSAFLTNAKTLKKEEVVSTSIQKEYDLYTSPEGLEDVIASLGNLDLRDLPITLNRGKHYLGLVYNDGKVFKFFQDIDDLPEGLDRVHVKPITLFQFVYISVYQMDGKYPGFVTRYPITGYGSIYPSFIRFTTTVRTLSLRELGDDWEPMEGDDYIASGFPMEGEEDLNTQVVHGAHLGRLGGDYDGDAASLTMVLSDDAIGEIGNYLERKEYYVDDAGNLNFSSSTDTLEGVLAYLTA